MICKRELTRVQDAGYLLVEGSWPQTQVCSSSQALQQGQSPVEHSSRSYQALKVHEKQHSIRGTHRRPQGLPRTILPPKKE